MFFFCFFFAVRLVYQSRRHIYVGRDYRSQTSTVQAVGFEALHMRLNCRSVCPGWLLGIHVLNAVCGLNHPSVASNQSGLAPCLLVASSRLRTNVRWTDVRLYSTTPSQGSLKRFPCRTSCLSKGFRGTCSHFGRVR